MEVSILGRCSGCSGDRCSCIIKAGSGTSVTGAGTQANPYVIEAQGGGEGGAAFPAGMITAFGGSVAPAGWLLCNGQAVSRTAYSALFAAIGIQYGDGGPAGTHFNVPDLAGRFPLGSDASHPMGSSTEGGTIDRGSETYTLTQANLPAHVHSIAHTHDASHNHSASSNNVDLNHAHHFVVGGGGHEHVYERPQDSRQYAGGTLGAWNSFRTGATTTGGGGHTHEGDTFGVAGGLPHLHAITVDTRTFSTGGSSAANSGSTGSANPTPVKTMPPWTGVTYIIKT